MKKCSEAVCGKEGGRKWRSLKRPLREEHQVEGWGAPGQEGEEEPLVRPGGSAQCALGVEGTTHTTISLTCTKEASHLILTVEGVNNPPAREDGEMVSGVLKVMLMLMLMLMLMPMLMLIRLIEKVSRCDCVHHRSMRRWGWGGGGASSSGSRYVLIKPWCSLMPCQARSFCVMPDS